MIRVWIGRALRWFIDAAEDADAAARHSHRRSFDFSAHARELDNKQRRERRSAELAAGFFTTEGMIRKIEIGPGDIVMLPTDAEAGRLRKPVDIPFRRTRRNAV